MELCVRTCDVISALCLGSPLSPPPHFKSLPRLLSWDGAGEVALNRAAIIFRISANYLHFISENAGAKLKLREFLKK